MVLEKEGPCLSIKAGPELNIYIAAVEEDFKYLRLLVPNASTKWLVWLVSISVWFRFDIQLMFREFCILQHEYINKHKFAVKHLQLEHTFCKVFVQPSEVMLWLSQALDLWAMGVTLYCFVFGKASVHFLCYTISEGWHGPVRWKLLSCLDVAAVQFIYINEYTVCLKPITVLVFLARKLWHNFFCFSSLATSVPIYWWEHIGFAQ